MTTSAFFNLQDEMKYRLCIVNDYEFLWFLILGVKLCIRKSYAQSVDLTDTTILLNHIQGMPFIDKDSQQKALHHGWDAFIQTTYIRVYNKE